MSSEWTTYINEGNQYIKNAQKSIISKKLTPEILYNMILMGIEKLVMGTLLKQHKMPYDHTIFDLISSLKEVTPIDPEMEKELTHLDSYNNLCSLDPFESKPISYNDLDTMIMTTIKFMTFLKPIYEN